MLHDLNVERLQSVVMKSLVSKLQESRNTVTYEWPEGLMK